MYSCERPMSISKYPFAMLYPFAGARPGSSARCVGVCRARIRRMPADTSPVQRSSIGPSKGSGFVRHPFPLKIWKIGEQLIPVYVKLRRHG
ncbi:hypothetical protein PsYK624_041000 [Phanerochaete sordida]|uniref:Uncharacterized protein n=1 Tax=Phanerochaete sordida TaxID=48140 RepID=A0A9P3LBN4_9APHY|nr:hypothetical protein PsYK624_041000 [Phanerochaete sordida]